MEQQPTCTKVGPSGSCGPWSFSRLPPPLGEGIWLPQGTTPSTQNNEKFRASQVFLTLLCSFHDFPLPLGDLRTSAWPYKVCMRGSLPSCAASSLPHSPHVVLSVHSPYFAFVTLQAFPCLLAPGLCTFSHSGTLFPEPLLPSNFSWLALQILAFIISSSGSLPQHPTHPKIWLVSML